MLRHIRSTNRLFLVKYFHTNVLLTMELSIYYTRKVFRNHNILYPLIRTRTCVYQGLY